MRRRQHKQTIKQTSKPLHDDDDTMMMMMTIAALEGYDMYPKEFPGIYLKQENKS